MDALLQAATAVALGTVGACIYAWYQLVFAMVG